MLKASWFRYSRKNVTAIACITVSTSTNCMGLYEQHRDKDIAPIALTRATIETSIHQDRDEFKNFYMNNFQKVSRLIERAINKNKVESPPGHCNKVNAMNLAWQKFIKFYNKKTPAIKFCTIPNLVVRTECCGNYMHYNILENPTFPMCRQKLNTQHIRFEAPEEEAICCICQEEIKLS